MKMTKEMIKQAMYDVEDIVDCLIDMVGQHCGMKDGSLCSMCNSSDALAMAKLAELGLLKIESQYGRMVTGYWAKEGESDEKALGANEEEC